MKFKNSTKKRVIILGSNSFIGKSIVKKLQFKKCQIILISRKEINLTSKNATNKLKKKIKKNDIIIFVAAVAPVKNIKMLNINLLICKNVIEALKEIQIKHLIYISSDAVYSDSNKKINEQSTTIPTSLHGFMHLIRETMLQDLNCIKTFVRPTLVYGENDPHNGYGPNKFIRLAQNNKQIILFGKGEERRDHIHVDDLALILLKIIQKRTGGIINAVSGRVISFYEIAQSLKKVYPNLKINTTKRSGPMPHNGYRAFENSLLKKRFPNILLRKLSTWIKKKEKYKNI